MQPYQQADAQIKKKGEAPLKGIKTAGSLAAGGLALNRVLPLLSQYIPADLAIKGLSKVDSRFGKFINTSMQNGKSFDDARQFIFEKARGKENPQENRNLIQQYSPELFEFLISEVEKGKSPIEAGALAEQQSNFKNVIKQMADDHKAPFSAILQTVFGQGAGQGQQQGQSQQQPQQGGGSDDQLISALQNILQM